MYFHRYEEHQSDRFIYSLRRYHPRLQSKLDEFSGQFSTLKNPRRLVWMKQLGTVELEVEAYEKDEDGKLISHVKTVSCTPAHATLLAHFEDKDEWTSEELSSETEMPEDMVRKRMGFWLNQRVVQSKRSGDDMIYSLISVSEADAIDQSFQHDDEHQEQAVSLGAHEEEEMKVYESYIIGMLSNLGQLPIERIHSSLKTFGMSSDLKLQYSVMSLTTWLDAFHNKPRITAKMSLGTQFPLECSMQMKKMHRAGRMSVAWSPLQGYKLKGMINRDLISKSCGLRKRFASNLGIGVEHTGLSGLKWLIQYQRPDGLTVRVPIFLQSFLSPGYWNRVVFVTTLSYLADETVEEWLGISSEVAETTSDTSTIQKICTNEKEMQWLSTPQAKRGARQQLSIIASVAKTKRQSEEATNGLVILKATYSYAYASLSAPAISPKLLSEDVTQQLQFYVDNSRLCLPASSKSLLLGFYNLCIGYGTNIGTTNVPDFPPLSKFIDRFISTMNHWLSFLGLGGKVVLPQSLQQNDRSAMLIVRYKFKSRVFEISVADSSALELPSNDAVHMGASDNVF